MIVRAEENHAFLPAAMGLRARSLPLLVSLSVAGGKYCRESVCWRDSRHFSVDLRCDIALASTGLGAQASLAAAAQVKYVPC